MLYKERIFLLVSSSLREESKFRGTGYIGVSRVPRPRYSHVRQYSRRMFLVTKRERQRRADGIYAKI